MRDDDGPLWDHVRRTFPERVAGIEALPEKYQRGVLLLLIGLDGALSQPGHPAVPSLAKLGEKLERNFRTGSSHTNARQIVLDEITRHAADLATLAVKLSDADEYFAHLAPDRLAEVMAAYAPGRSGPGSQGIYLTAARLSTACNAFGDEDELTAQRAFKNARHEDTRLRKRRTRPKTVRHEVPLTITDLSDLKRR